MKHKHKNNEHKFLDGGARREGKAGTRTGDEENDR